MYNQEEVTRLTQLKLGDYKFAGDSVSLAKIDGQKFTITGIEDSDYTEGNDVTTGVKITTEQEFTVNGKSFNKFHTTRIAIVELLKNSELRQKITNGDTLGPIICKKFKSERGKDYFNFEEA